MEMYGIVRTSAVNAEQQVCVGSSPISGKPYWAKLGSEPATQPLLFRESSYAEWCIKDICREQDRKAGDNDWTYDLFRVRINLP